MCDVKLKVMIHHTPSETCINKFCKTFNFCADYKKLHIMYLGPGFTQRCAGPLKVKLQSIKNKGEFKNSNFQTYVVCHEEIFQQVQNLKPGGYTDIDISTCVCFFLLEIDNPSLKTVVQICESQASYSTVFHACASYLTLMVQKTPAAERVHITAAATEVGGGWFQAQEALTNTSLLQSTQEVFTSCFLLCKTSASGKTTRRPRLMGMASWQPKRQ